MDKLQEHSPLPSSSTLMSGVAVIGCETFLRNGTVGFQDMAAAPVQHCVGFQSKVPPDHAGCGNAPHSHPLDASGHLGDVGLQGVIFWTQISSKSKTLKTATEKKPCHIENGNKIKEASVSGGNCWCASNFEKPSDYVWNWISKVNLSAFRYCNKVDILHPEELRASPQCSTACACWKPCAQSGSTVGRRRLISHENLDHNYRPMIGLQSHQICTKTNHGWTEIIQETYKSLPSLDTHQFTSSQMSWRLVYPPSIKALSGILHFRTTSPSQNQQFSISLRKYKPKTGWKQNWNWNGTQIPNISAEINHFFKKKLMSCVQPLYILKLSLPVFFG